MVSWKMKLLIRWSRGATKNKIFPRNEISLVPSELVIINVVLTISLEFLPSLPSPSFHDALHHLCGTWCEHTAHFLMFPSVPCAGLGTGDT